MVLMYSSKHGISNVSRMLSFVVLVEIILVAIILATSVQLHGLVLPEALDSIKHYAAQFQTDEDKAGFVEQQ